jgi:hypothetical protein
VKVHVELARGIDQVAQETPVVDGCASCGCRAEWLTECPEIDDNSAVGSGGCPVDVTGLHSDAARNQLVAEQVLGAIDRDPDQADGIGRDSRDFGVTRQGRRECPRPRDALMAGVIGAGGAGQCQQPRRQS